MTELDVDLAAGTHVVLGAGQVGGAIARELVGRDADVRVVSRSGAVPADLEGAVDAVAADVSRVRDARDACRDASVVYFCLQPPYDRWPELFPPLVDGGIAGAADAGARFVMADNLYAYGPVSGPIHEGSPADAASEKGRTRAAIADTVLDAHESGRVAATVGRASDFYGPGVTDSIVGDRFFPSIVDGDTVWFPGDPDQPHTYTYLPDFARALVVLGARDVATGEVWHVPSPPTLTTREFAALAADVAGTDPTVRQVPSWLMRLLAVVSSTVAELREIQYQRTEPFVVSHERFRDAFDLDPTPHRVALDRTIEWYRTRQ